MKRGVAVYIMTNKIHSTLYTGVTSDLKKRIYEHKNNIFPDSFTAIYKTHKLVYYEGFHRIDDAIAREKQIKGGSRNKKIQLINSLNPDWKDLCDECSCGRDCFAKPRNDDRTHNVSPLTIPFTFPSLLF